MKEPNSTKPDPARPTWKDLRAAESRTYRRILLDSFLGVFLANARGLLIDLGGKKRGRHGSFKPEDFKAVKWININIAMESNPQVAADVCALPIRDGCTDLVLCTETLEHLRDPLRCIHESLRILKPGGTLLLSVPFLYPVHADPFDFQRFTGDGLRAMLQNFVEVEVRPMGGFWGVVGLFFDLQSSSVRLRILRGFMRRMGRFLCWVDAWNGNHLSFSIFTTGYFCCAKKAVNG